MEEKRQSVVKSAVSKAEEIEKRAEGEVAKLFEEPGTLDEKGRYNVAADLRGEEVFAPYSGRLLLNDSLLSFLEEEEEGAPVGAPLHASLIVENRDEAEEKAILKAYRRHYENKLEQKKKEIKRTLWITLFLMALGVLFLALYGVTNVQLQGTGFEFWVPECLSIAAWVFVWTGTEKIFFDRPKARFERRHLERMKDAEVSFVEEEGK